MKAVVHRLPSRVANVFGSAFGLRVLALLMLVNAVIAGSAGSMGYAAFLVLVAAAAFAMASVANVVQVGPEGVVIRWLGRPLFIPHAELESFEGHVALRNAELFGKRVGGEERSRGVLLRLRHRAPIYLVCEDDAQIGRLLETLRLARESPPAARELPQLARGERSVATWVEGLRRMGDEGGYREAAPSPDLLWEVLENPSSPPEARAAAALALRARLGADASPRLRVAMGECLEPRLRVALEAIDAEDQPATEAHLETLSQRRS